MYRAERTDTHAAYYEHVLGTSLEIQLRAKSVTAARQAEAAILAEIARLEAVFSTYAATSELRRWLDTRGIAQPLSRELLELLTAAEGWRQETGGIFHPGTAELAGVWLSSAARKREPTAAELHGWIARRADPLWSVDAAAGTATRLTESAVTLDALAKGVIVDRACERAAAVPGVRSALVNIGGDLRASGDAGVEVAIADPSHDAENAAPIARVRLGRGALASSGGYRRGFRIGDCWYAHLFDPRRGRPVEHVASASVAAPTAAEADVLSTVFSILSPEESLALADARPEIACLLVTRDGPIYRNRRWRALERG